PDFVLVLRQHSIFGYSDFSFVRVWSIANCQSTRTEPRPLPSASRWKTARSASAASIRYACILAATRPSLPPLRRSGYPEGCSASQREAYCAVELAGVAEHS